MARYRGGSNAQTVAAGTAAPPAALGRAAAWMPATRHVPSGARASKGPPLVQMPDLFRTDEQAAVKALTDLGLKVKVTYPIGFTPFGRVVEQSVKAGTQIPWGTTVQLNVV